MGIVFDGLDGAGEENDLKESVQGIIIHKW